MLRAFYMEIDPNKKQTSKINQTIGVCRFVYNFYVDYNGENYKSGGKFVSGMDFSKWMNNEYIPQNPDKLWIKDVSSKAVKQSIMNGEAAFRKFFKEESGYPNFKKKSKQDVKAYFPKNNKTDWTIQRHRIKIPTLGFVRLKEKGYIPINAVIKSGTVSRKADRYYVSILCEMNAPSKERTPYSEGVGLDLGLKDFGVCSDGLVFKNINKTDEIKRLEKQLKREQRRLSRMFEFRKKRKKKGIPTKSKNLQKQILKVQKLHAKLTNIRENYINQVVNTLVKAKPKYITIEDLNVKGMMKNRHLSKAISKQNFYKFKTKLIAKAKINGIEVRIVSRWYPSSKTCSCCGHIKSDLKLKDRKFVCPNCGTKLDRDWNASINLRNAKEYVVA